MRALRLFEDISSGKSVLNVLHQDFDLSVLKVSGSVCAEGPGRGVAWLRGGPGALCWQDQSLLRETFPPGTNQVCAETQLSTSRLRGASLLLFLLRACRGSQVPLQQWLEGDTGSLAEGRAVGLCWSSCLSFFCPNSEPSAARFGHRLLSLLLFAGQH